MKTGDAVRDGQGNSYLLGPLLGRGAWGKSYLVRRESTDSLHVLKVPIGPDDLPADVASPEAAFPVAREALMEAARIYDQGEAPFLPRLEARFTLPDGQPALLLPRYAESLEKRLVDGMTVGALLDVLLQVVKHIRQLAPLGVVPTGLHGNLRPTNILFTDRGDLVLADLATPAVRRGYTKLLPLLQGGSPYLPPEFVEGTGEPPWTPAVDTYALAMILWRGLSEGDPAYVRQRLDKASIVAVKDRLVDRMKQEDSNPRFHGRLAERVGVFLSRALSREMAPSPPYRFQRFDEFQQRLEEIIALIRPQVSSVGKVLLDRSPANPTFSTDESVAFSCTVGCSTGIDNHDEIGVGIAVFDLERDLRLKELDLGYSVDKHPSGRYRFAFRVASLPPGLYRARVAFAIRDSGQPPATTEVEFEVRAAAGWVPPSEPMPAQALPFDREVSSGPTAVPVPSEKEPTVPTPPPVVSAPVRAEPAAPPAYTLPPRRADTEPLAATPRPITPTPPPSAAPPTRPAPAPVAAASPTPPRSDTVTLPSAVRPPEPAPEPPAEPAFKAPRNWSYEPVPRPESPRADEEPRDPPSNAPIDDEDVEPGLVEKALAQLRDDPYVLVMAALALIIAVLLILYLVIRS